MSAKCQKRTLALSGTMVGRVTCSVKYLTSFFWMGCPVRRQTCVEVDVLIGAPSFVRRFALQHNISDLNKRRWSGKLAGHAYRKAKGLFPAEQVLIELVSPRISGKRILDIGIGTGRTTEPLRSLSRDYVGIDYSPEMIRYARQRFPEVDYRCIDARDLADFADGSFDLVWFSFNGIDYVSHEDRLQILSEIYRVTKSGGLFCFSSHNRDFRGIELDKRLRAIELMSNPLKLAYRVIRYGWSMYNAWELKGRQSCTPEFAIFNDSELDHRLLTYYSTLQNQIDQLRLIGFGKIEAFDEEGKRLDVNVPYENGFMMHYLSEKPKTGPKARIAGQL